MAAKYDIFRKTNDSVIWVEAVEDIVKVKNRLVRNLLELTLNVGAAE